MDLNAMVADINRTKTALDEAKARFDSAELQSRTHCTDNYDHFANLVKQAYQQYEAAYNAYDAACKAVLSLVGDQLYAAGEAFVPVQERLGDPSQYYESQEG